MFLPDRYIKGECPKCHAKDQYGDNCEVCGAVYAPTDLIKPYSALSGAQRRLRNIPPGEPGGDWRGPHRPFGFRPRDQISVYPSPAPSSPKRLA